VNIVESYDLECVLRKWKRQKEFFHVRWPSKLHREWVAQELWAHHVLDIVIPWFLHRYQWMQKVLYYNAAFYIGMGYPGQHNNMYWHLRKTHVNSQDAPEHNTRQLLAWIHALKLHRDKRLFLLVPHEATQLTFFENSPLFTRDSHYKSNVWVQLQVHL